MKPFIEISKKGNLVAVLEHNDYRYYDLKVIEPHIREQIILHRDKINYFKLILEQSCELQRVCDTYFNIKHPEKEIERLVEKLFIDEVKI